LRTRRFIQCDVFSPIPAQGNALAVVVDGDGLPDTSMRRFAAWTNLAETTFLMPPNNLAADYKVRIFTPTREMLFAGHPTLGSCAAWLHSGGVPKNPGIVVQECGVGLVEIDITQPDMLAFKAPPTEIKTLPDQSLTTIIEALEIPRSVILKTALLDNGPVWQLLQLETAKAVLEVDSSRVRWPEFKAIGLIGAHPVGVECNYEVRMLAPSSGMSEDPVTGSLNSAIAHWLYAHGKLSGPVTIAQGTNIGRHGRVHIQPDEDGTTIAIGGRVHILIQGTLAL